MGGKPHAPERAKPLQFVADAAQQLDQEED